MVFQRFKRVQDSRTHSLVCQAEKPTTRKRNDESESESEPPLRQRQNGGRRPPPAVPPLNPSATTFKECSVIIKRVGYIETAIKENYSTLTRIGRNGRRQGSWIKKSY